MNSSTPVELSLEVIDRAAIERLRQVPHAGRTLFHHLIDIYEQDARLLVARLEAGLLKGDREAVHRAAHTLRGNSSVVGAREISARAIHLVEQYRSGETISPEEGPALDEALSRFLRTIEPLR